MPLDLNGNWYPTLDTHQIPAFNTQKRVVLLSGPSLSGKSRVALNRLCRHLWENDFEYPRVGFFSKTMKNSKQTGAWDILNRITIPEWIKANIGFEYTTMNNEGKPGWKVDGITRTPYFRVRNRWGRESECYLYSLDVEDDIEEKIKEQEFTMLYFAELDKFLKRKVFSVSAGRLRLGKMAQQMWLADTNPAEDGEDSWVHDIFFKERTMSYEDYKIYCQKKNFQLLDEKSFKQWQDSLELIEMFPEQNTFLEPERLEQLKADNAYDPDLYARYVEGKWVSGFGSRSYHLRGSFKAENLIGNCDGLDESKWEYANPSRGCTDLITGWDIGEVNHAGVILESRLIKNRPHFILLDEVEEIEEEVSVEQFTISMMKKINELERISGRIFDLSHAWSDSSSINNYNAAADTYPYLIVMAQSGNRIELQGVEKAMGSVKLRVKLLKQLLFENRLIISCHCTGTQRMLKYLKQGMTTRRLEYVKNDENKHLFDALTYALLKECAEEYEMLTVMQSIGKREPVIISV